MLKRLENLKLRIHNYVANCEFYYECIISANERQLISHIINGLKLAVGDKKTNVKIKVKLLHCLGPRHFQYTTKFF